MRLPIKVKVRREDKLVEEDAILWIGEVPPECRRGKNRKMKTNRYKRERMERLQEGDDVRR